MKKYIIRYANGSECPEIKDKFNSRKEAGEALMDYICDHNEDLNIDDDDYLSPFDFALEEVECKEVNKVITDFDSARKALGIKPNADFYVVNRKHSEKVAHLQETARLTYLQEAARLVLFEDVARLVTDINSKHIKALIALNKLFTIAEVWNKEDGFVPDFSDLNQDKWFPWFKYDKDAAGFVTANTIDSPSRAGAYLGSRLCFKTPERAEQFDKQFEDLYNKIFL